MKERQIKSTPLTVRAALSHLNECRKYMTRQQVRTFKGQILAGDVEGALRGMKKLTGDEVCEMQADDT